jgi:hypothetical protein
VFASDWIWKKMFGSTKIALTNKEIFKNILKYRRDVSVSRGSH